MSEGERIAAEAREWIGTPFHWQGRIKGKGVDCKGLVAGVARACGRPEGESLEALAGDYGRVVDHRRLQAGLRNLFDRAQAIEPGDVLLLLLGDPPKPQHLAIAISDRRMVHCYGGGPNRVIEAPIGHGRLHSVWRWR